MLEIILTLTGALLGIALIDEQGLIIGGLLGLLLGFVLSTRLRVGRQARELEALRTRLDALATELPPVEMDLAMPATPPAREAPSPPPANTSDNASVGTPTDRVDGEPAPRMQASTRSAPDFGHVVEPLSATVGDEAADTGVEAMDSAAPDVTPGIGPASAGRSGPQTRARAERAAPAAASKPLADAMQAALTFLREANTVVLVGIVVLFFGFAFLAKLAIDADLVPIELRLAGIAGFGILLLLAGWRFRHERRTFGLPLQGGGVGIMFLTVFAAYRLYGVIPAELCFGLLVALVIFGVLLAVLQNAAALASLAVSGGFLAPVLASTGSGDHVTLFSYYLLLNAGIVTIAWFKAWRILNLIGFAFTFIIGTLWGAQYYRPELFYSTEPFLLAHFVLYTAVSVLFAMRQPPRVRGLVDGTLVFGTPLVVFALQSQLVSDIEMGLAWSAVAGAAFYMVLAAALSRSRDFRLLLEAFVANGVVLATIAVPLALDARWTSVTWALEGAGVLWIGVRQDRRLPRVAGSALQLLAGGAWIMHVQGEALRDVTLFANGQYLGGALIGVAGLFCGAYLHAARARLRPCEQVLAGMLGAWALAWWYAGGLWELAERAPAHADWGALLLFLALSVLALAWLYHRLRWALLRVALTGHVVLLALSAAFMAIDEKHPFVALAWLGWPAALFSQLVALRVLDHWSHWLRALTHAALLWLTSALLAWGAAYWFDQWLDGQDLWQPVAFGIVPALLAILTVRATRGTRWPVGVHASGYLQLGLAPIVALLVAWVWIINLLPPGSNWPITYLPILNPIDVANGFALIAMASWLRQCRWHFDDWPRAQFVNPIRVTLAATLFVWANAVLLRSIHFWAGIAYDPHSLWHADITQSSLAVFWSVLGVGGMWIGARKHLRTVWFAAAGLMGVVVLKLFFVDLANTDTLERVISFVSVGLLMVLVGYFAPVPPRAADDEQAQAPVA